MPTLAMQRMLKQFTPSNNGPCLQCGRPTKHTAKFEGDRQVLYRRSEKATWCCPACEAELDRVMNLGPLPAS